MLTRLRRFLIGRPLATEMAVHERLTNPKALAVFSSDALSSVAYATEEILRVLVVAGAAATAYALPIGGAIVALLFIVALSYRQTIHGYPSGGGAYIVAKDNLGTLPGLVAGAALLVDYVLTVAVSIAAGVAAITSAAPGLHPHRVPLAIVLIAFMTIANLRGVRESGTLFAAPTYLFIGSMGLLLAVGAWRALTGGAPIGPEEATFAAAVGAAPAPVTLFLLLRAFASGCAALTGVEAISNGVPAFKPPEARNAARTLAWMAAILATTFAGITLLAHRFAIIPRAEETVISSIARVVFGGGPGYYLIQAATALILVLAANTSYADFPRLASLIARDGYLPRPLANRGDRLAFSNGILLLGVLSAALVAAFGGDTHRLIPLYAVGVFLSFTLSQSGMVRHWLRDRRPGWLGSAAVNGLGAAVTAVVLVVIGATKFAHGAWAVIAVIPLLVRTFIAVHRHYVDFAREMRRRTRPARAVKHTVVVPVAGINPAVAATLQYAKSLTRNVTAVYVEIEPGSGEKLAREWRGWEPDVPLIVVPSPYRSVIGPLLDYVQRVDRADPDDIVTVMVPEFVTTRWWHRLLHNQTALMIRLALGFRRGIVVTSVPYHLNH